MFAISIQQKIEFGKVYTFLKEDSPVRIRKTLRSHGYWPEEGPRKTIGALMTHPCHAHFLLFCEEGLPSGMFLSEEG